MVTKGIALCLAVLVVWIGISAQAQEKSSKAELSEIFVGQIDYSSWIGNTLRVSPDNRRVAYANRAGNRVCMVLDGKAGKNYDRVSPLVFSPDSKRVAYVAMLENKVFVVVDGEEKKQYDSLGTNRGIGSVRMYGPGGNSDSLVSYAAGGPIRKDEGTLTFSTDSKRVAYVAMVQAGASLVVDEKEGRLYNGIGEPIFSPDTGHVAYRAVLAGLNRWCMVIDDKEGNKYPDCTNPIFSPDSSRIAYAGKAGNKWFVIVDGNEQKRYDKVGYPLFTADSQRVAYVTKLGDKQFVVVDGIEEKKYDFVGGLIFSPNSKRIVYVAKEGGKYFVVVEGKEGKKYDSIGTPFFSP